jgi:hypothetical protein
VQRAEEEVEQPRVGRHPHQPHQVRKVKLRSAVAGRRRLRVEVQRAKERVQRGGADPARDQQHRGPPPHRGRHAVGAFHFHDEGSRVEGARLGLPGEGEEPAGPAVAAARLLHACCIPFERQREGGINECASRPRNGSLKPRVSPTNPTKSAHLDVVGGGRVAGRAADRDRVPLPRRERGDVEQHKLRRGVRQGTTCRGLRFELTRAHLGLRLALVAPSYEAKHTDLLFLKNAFLKKMAKRLCFEVMQPRPPTHTPVASLGGQ